MQIHNLKPTTKNKTKKRIGRGGKRGTYSGKGLKGQKSRAGRKMRPEMRDIIKKIHKKRGYRFSSFKPAHRVVSLGVISKLYSDGETVSPRSLADKKIIQEKKIGRVPIKILANGSLDKNIIISGCEVSKNVKVAVEKVGGVVK